MTPQGPVPGTVPGTLNAALERSAGFADFGLRFVDRREQETFHPWHELRLRALAVAAGLRHLGVESGERVALIFPTGAAFFDAFFGALLAGAVPVPLYPPVRLGRLAEYHRRTARMIGMAGARLLLAGPRVKRLLGETVAQARPALGCRTPDEVAGLARRGEPFEEVAVATGDLALVQFSSGTTVEPKPVALTHRAVLAQARALNAFWPNRGVTAEAGALSVEEGGATPPGAAPPLAEGCGERGHSGVCWLPLYHDMGLIGCVFPALARPAMLTLLPPEAFVARPALWLRAMSRYRATISPAPNFAYGLCVHKVRDEEMEGVDLSCWVGALNGAEPVAPRVLRAFRDRFARWGLRRSALTPVYGLSEAALAVTFSPLAEPFTSRRFQRAALVEEGRAEVLDGGHEDGARSPAELVASDSLEIASVGRPLPGFEIRVLAPADEDADASGEADAGTVGSSPERASPERAVPLPPGQVGQVWVRGPSLMEGYLGRPQDTARTLVDGWLDTGDLGFLLDGELYLTGRAKDVVILRGRNHSPAEIEQAVEGVAGLRRGCVVAVSHLAEGAETERLMLFVEAAPGATVKEREGLPAACSRAVLGGTNLAVDEVVVVEPGTLSRTSSGKLRRRETLALYLAGELAPPARVTALRMVGELARSGVGFVRAGLGRGGVEDRDGAGAGESEGEGEGEAEAGG